MAAAQPLPAASTPVLRVAAAWGNTIVGVKLLQRGQDCILGEVSGALAAMPDGLAASPVPLRAGAGSWELDARGATPGAAKGDGGVAAGTLAAPVPMSTSVGSPSGPSLDAGVVEAKTLDGGTHVFKFSELDIEGRLKSPQLVYFLRRVRAEFAAGELGHRSFMREMSETRKESTF